MTLKSKNMPKPKVANITWNGSQGMWQGWTGRQYLFAERLSDWDIVPKVNNYRQPLYSKTSPIPLVPGECR